MTKLSPIYGIVAIALAAFAYFSLFIVPEGRQAVVLQFGRVIPPAKYEAGLYFKLPWRQVRILEKRVLNWDGRPSEIPTREKKYITVDTTARYKIADPITFIRSLGDVYEAQNRLQTWINNATREVISSNNLVETVRNTNEIIERQDQEMADFRQTHEEARVEGGAELDIRSLELIADQEISGELEPITIGREQLTAMLIDKARESMEQYGLELVDVQIKRVALEESVEQEVYKRMITERERIAEKIRSIGRQEQAKIRGEIQRELQDIESSAYLKIQKIKGQADAEAIRIYAKALEGNPELYRFLRTLEAYEHGLRDDSRMIISADSDFLKLLKDGPNALR